MEFKSNVLIQKYLNSVRLRSLILDDVRMLMHYLEIA